MTTYGYIRVSSKDQNEARQIKKMIELGVPEENLFIDKASGKDLNRDSYQRLMEIAVKGDLILLDSLDRLGRNYFDIIEQWKELTRERGIDLRCLDLEFFDSAKFREMGDIGICVEDMLLSLLAYVAQTERKKTRQRQAEGIAIAKAEGKYKGRKKTAYSEELLEETQGILQDKGKQAAARFLGVNPCTIYAMLKDGRLRA